jgi:surface protein
VFGLLIFGPRPPPITIAKLTDYDARLTDLVTRYQLVLRLTRNVVLKDQDCYRPFISNWRTAQNNQQIEISGVGNNYTISWQKIDDASVKGTTTGVNTTYLVLPKQGDFKIRILPGSGTFTQFTVSYDPKIRSIDQWGDIAWSSMAYAFEGCNNLIYNAPDVSDLSDVTNMNGMFHSSSAFNGDLNDWDVSKVTNMSNMFNGASAFTGALIDWNVSKVTDMSYMFQNAISFGGNLSNWNVGKVTDIRYMFKWGQCL